MSDAPVVLRFVYRNASDEVKPVALMGWHESGHYVRGRCLEDGRWKTYRIDRVVEYLDSCDRLLKRPFQEPPPRLHVVGRHANVRSDVLEISFTGFKDQARAELEARALDVGLKVVKSVTKKLKFLVGGPNAGPKKMEAARQQSVYLLNERQFDALASTGELPDEQVHRFGASSTSIKVDDPDGYFSHWHFAIGQHHWATFGMTLRDFVRTREDGSTETYQSWAIDPILGFDFQAGDMFYPRGTEREEFVQVAYNTEDGEVEVHHGNFRDSRSRRGYMATYEQLAFWLETSKRPTTLVPVYRGNSRAGLLAWQLPEGDD